MYNVSRELAIKPSEYNIREQYLRFNALFFEDALPEDLNLEFTSLRDKKAMGVFSFPKNSQVPLNPELCTIRLDTS